MNLLNDSTAAASFLPLILFGYLYSTGSALIDGVVLIYNGSEKLSIACRRSRILTLRVEKKYSLPLWIVFSIRQKDK